MTAILFEAKGAGRGTRSAQPQAQPPKLWADDSNPLLHPWLLSCTQEGDKGV